MSLEEILRHYQFDLSTLKVPEYQRGGKNHPLYSLSIPADNALQQWEQLRNLVPETHYWPVLGWDRFKKPPWQENPPQESIDKGLHLKIQEWIERQKGEEERDAITERGEVQQVYAPFVFQLHHRAFPFTFPPLIPVSLVPTENCWEVPAYLPVTVNEWDPSPAVHIAFMKYWHEQLNEYKSFWSGGFSGI